MTLTERMRAELDESFGGEPLDRPVAQRLADGHRALRRRRAVGVLAACGVVAALGTTYAVGSSGASRDAGPVVAADPTPSAAASTDPATLSWEDDTPIQYLDGQLYVRPGVVVHERVENPLRYRSPRTSDALDLTFHDQRMWIITDATDHGFGYSSSVPTGTGFRDWVDEQVSLGGAGPETSGPRVLRLTEDGQVVPIAETQVLQRTDDPRLGDGFAPAGAATGAAIVRTGGDETSYFVVWRVVDGKLDVISTPPGDTIGATFTELLNAARSRYASGEGLR
jgi:hypothetical protein